MNAVELLRKYREDWEAEARFYGHLQQDDAAKLYQERADALSRIEAVVLAAQKWARLRREMEDIRLPIVTDEDERRANRIIEDTRNAELATLDALSVLEEDTHANDTHQ